jgi:hypothetical protein
LSASLISGRESQLKGKEVNRPDQFNDTQSTNLMEPVITFFGWKAAVLLQLIKGEPGQRPVEVCYKEEFTKLASANRKN